MKLQWKNQMQIQFLPLWRYDFPLQNRCWPAGGSMTRSHPRTEARSPPWWSGQPGRPEPVPLLSFMRHRDMFLIWETQEGSDSRHAEWEGGAQRTLCVSSSNVSADESSLQRGLRLPRMSATRSVKNQWVKKFRTQRIWLVQLESVKSKETKAEVSKMKIILELLQIVCFALESVTAWFFFPRWQVDSA